MSREIMNHMIRQRKRGNVPTVIQDGVLKFNIGKRILILFGMRVHVTTAMGLSNRAHRVDGMTFHSMHIPRWMRWIQYKLRKKGRS